MRRSSCATRTSASPRAADALRRRSRQARQGAHQRPHRDPGVPELAARRRRRDGRRRQVGRDLDGPPRLRVARQDRADTAVFNTPFMYRDPEHACAPPTRARRRRCRRSTRSWSRRATCASSPAFPGHAPAHLQGEGAVAEGHAGQEVPRRADQALVVDADRHGRGRHAGRGVRARHCARHRAGRRPGKPAAQHLQPQALRGAEVRDDDQPHAVGPVGLRQRERVPKHPGRRPQDHGGHDGRGRPKTLDWDRETAAKYRKDLEARA